MVCAVHFNDDLFSVGGVACDGDIDKGMQKRLFFYKVRTPDFIENILV